MKKTFKKSQVNNVLIALMNNPKDFLILQKELWYRIPTTTRVPKSITDNTLDYIAFYHTKKFKKERYTISYYGKVKSISIASRRELFPDPTTDNPAKARLSYYKIEIEKLISLEKPIINQRPRRILFIPTSKEKFFNTIKLNEPEINWLFNDSYLEDLLFQRLQDEDILSERQYYIETKGQKNYILDFAIFCKAKNINIECDGDTYHNKPEQVKNDKVRNNALTTADWTVLRYTTYQLKEDMDNTISQIKENIVNYGGVQDPKNKAKFHYPQKGNQLTLFDIPKTPKK